MLHKAFLEAINNHTPEKVQNPPPKPRVWFFSIPQKCGFVELTIIWVFLIIPSPPKKMDGWLNLRSDKSPSSCSIALVLPFFFFAEVKCNALTPLVLKILLC